MAAELSSPSAMHIVLMLLIVGSVLVVPWMLLEASEEEDRTTEEVEPSLMNYSMLLMLLPLVLLVVVRWMASEQAARLTLSNADASTIHRLTGSSPGLVLILLLILAMITLHSSLLQSLGVASQ